MPAELTDQTDVAARGSQVSMDVLLRTLDRERKSRRQAERLLEDRSRELFLAKEELRENLDSMQRTQSQLIHSEKMASVGQLAAGVAHEINNPVGFVSSNLQTLTDYIDIYQSLIRLSGELMEAVDLSDDSRVRQVRDQMTQIREEEDVDYVLQDTQDLLSESADGLRRVREIVQNLKSFVHLDKAEEQLADVNEGLEATL
ncbi:MAG: hypothetical protein KDA96_27010, partial [Planctomycetaceae bacterium]|nr:hypothetical protein [Planctomycetaceae bacterium]